MLHPIQRLHLHPASDRLYTATSNTLHVFTLSTGALLHTWTAPPPPSTTAAPATTTVDAPAPKKRKLDSTRPSRWSNAAVSTNNSIVRLLTPQTGLNLVVATAEDKCVRVFASDMRLLSTRALPKRIADVVCADDDTLLVGDRHGDVFELPVLGSDAPVVGRGGLSISEAEAEAKRRRTEIEYGLNYEHRFVLGHVGMLLKIAVVDGEGGKRRWVVTADRDEHVRVSRYPDAFVIERFLLGHQAFVSSLLVVDGDLISGGGDPYLLVWQWREGSVKQKIEMEDEQKVVVTGIWGFPAADAMLVAVERSPRIRMFVRSAAGVWEKGRDLELSAPVLDVAVSATEVYVTVDTQDPRELLKVVEWHDEGWKVVAHSPVVETIAQGVTKVDVPQHLEDAVRANVLYATGSLKKEILERDFRNTERDGGGEGEEGIDVEE